MLQAGMGMGKGMGRELCPSPRLLHRAGLEPVQLHGWLWVGAEHRAAFMSQFRAAPGSEQTSKGKAWEESAHTPPGSCVGMGTEQEGGSCLPHLPSSAWVGCCRCSTNSEQTGEASGSGSASVNSAPSCRVSAPQSCRAECSRARHGERSGCSSQSRLLWVGRDISRPCSPSPCSPWDTWKGAAGGGYLSWLLAGCLVPGLLAQLLHPLVFGQLVGVLSAFAGLLLLAEKFAGKKSKCNVLGTFC